MLFIDDDQGKHDDLKVVAFSLRLPSGRSCFFLLSFVFVQRAVPVLSWLCLSCICDKSDLWPNGVMFRVNGKMIE